MLPPIDTKGYHGLVHGTAPERWSKQRAAFDDQALAIEGHPVMERWETPYMQAFASLVTRNGGRILECGFGMGISAQAIQSYAPAEHVIVEANSDVFQRLKAFQASARHPVTPIQGFAAEVARSLQPSSFDGIFYDTYPLNAEEQHTHQFRFVANAYHLLKPGGILTYCNLTSTGVLRNQYPSWEALFDASQLPRLLEAGVPQLDIKGFILLRVSPPSSCRYYQHPLAMIPMIVKS
jgi:guanidinoacetate N-methyltransferase